MNYKDCTKMPEGVILEQITQFSRKLNNDNNI